MIHRSYQLSCRNMAEPERTLYRNHQIDNPGSWEVEPASLGIDRDSHMSFLEWIKQLSAFANYDVENGGLLWETDTVIISKLNLINLAIHCESYELRVLISELATKFEAGAKALINLRKANENLGWAAIYLLDCTDDIAVVIGQIQGMQSEITNARMSIFYRLQQIVREVLDALESECSSAGARSDNSTPVE